MHTRNASARERPFVALALTGIDMEDLGRICQSHLKTDKPQTKLVILQQAVQIIQQLEIRLQGESMLKQRQNMCITPPFVDVSTFFGN